MLALLAGNPSPVRGGNVDEYKLKAAFVYKFVALTSWPEDDKTAFRFCIFGDDPFRTHVQQITSRTLAGRPIEVHRAHVIANLTECRAVYVAPAVITRLAQVLSHIGHDSTLIIADSVGALERGAMINMIQSGGRLGFEVNLKHANECGLQMRSNFLRIAKRVVR